MEVQWPTIPAGSLRCSPELFRNFDPTTTARNLILLTSSGFLIEILSLSPNPSLFLRIKIKTSLCPLWPTWQSPSRMCKTWTPFSSTCPTAQISTRTRLRYGLLLHWDVRYRGAGEGSAGCETEHTRYLIRAGGQSPLCRDIGHSVHHEFLLLCHGVCSLGTKRSPIPMLKRKHRSEINHGSQTSSKERQPHFPSGTTCFKPSSKKCCPF